MWMDSWVRNIPYAYWPRLGGAFAPEERALVRFFEVHNKCVVLANSNQAEREVQLDACMKDSIPVLKRKGGGGTVVLGPGCVVLTLAFHAKNPFSNLEYFRLINLAWMDALTSLGVAELSQRGVSDICLGSKKIAGTSIFRSKELLIYQGSLLVCMNLDLIEKYLKHPSKEPDYRQGRSHLDFVTNLHKEGFQISTQEILLHCQNYFQDNLVSYLRGHFAMA